MQTPEFLQDCLPFRPKQVYRLMLNPTTMSFQVVVRVRPFTTREKEASQALSVLITPSEVTLYASIPLTYPVDTAIWSNGDEEDLGLAHVDNRGVFERVGRGVVGEVLEGKDCCVISYGANATGKSYTLFGGERETGLIQLSAIELLAATSQLCISMLEVHGNCLKETKKINLSLSCLGNVIHALVTSADHVPYRESKLTRLLQESLGGNFKTTVLVALSPCHRHYDETYNSIKFVQRAKHIRNRVTINIKSSPEAYQAIIDKLTEELKKAQSELEAARLLPRVVMGGGSMRRSRNGLVTADGSFRDKEGLSTDLEVSTEGVRSRRSIVMSCNHIDELKKAAELAGEQREKIRSLEADKQALREKVTELEENMRSANKKLLKQQREALDYKSKYHNAIIMMRKDNDECELMKKYNSELMQTVKKLRMELEQLDEKFSKSLDEKLQTSSSTILEFDDRVDSHYSHSHSSSSGSDDLPMEEEVHMPAPPKPLSIGPEETTKKYFETIRMKLDPDSSLNKESLLRQLQNNLLQ